MSVRKAIPLNDTKIDLSVPLDKSKVKVPEGSCLGTMWDMRSRECPVCAMNDICCILMKDKVDTDRKKIESTQVFLDQADWANLNEGELVVKCVNESGVLKVTELFDHIKKTARIEDEGAVVEYIKKFKADHGFKFREGIVWKD